MALSHVSVPVKQWLLGGVGILLPEGWHNVEAELLLEQLHSVSDVEGTTQTGVKIVQRRSDLTHEGVHTLALLEAHDDVWGLVLGLGVDIKHVEVWWEHGEEVVDDGLDLVVITSTTGATTLHSENGSEQGLRLSGQVTNLSVGVETEHLWLLWWQLLFDVLSVGLTVELLRVWGLEAWGKGKLHLLEDLGADQHMEVRLVGSAIPIVSNVTTIHDITVDVGKIFVWNLLVLGQVVVEHITANGQVTIVEVVVTRPALGAELLTSNNQGVEHAQAEQKGLELWEFVGLSLLEVSIIELGESTTNVRLEILRSLIRNLNGVLHDGLRDDFHLWQRWWFSRDEATEFWVGTTFESKFELTLELLHP